MPTAASTPRIAPTATNARTRESPAGADPIAVPAWAGICSDGCGDDTGGSDGAIDAGIDAGIEGDIDAGLAMSLGIDRRTAAEFSFFLAVPTLTGATVLQLYKHGAGIGSDMIGYILLGSLVSFVVAFLVVKAFLAVITRFGFGPFAWYRIIAGVAALIWLAMR